MILFVRCVAPRRDWLVAVRAERIVEQLRLAGLLPPDGSRAVIVTGMVGLLASVATISWSIGVANDIACLAGDDGLPSSLADGSALDRVNIMSAAPLSTSIAGAVVTSALRPRSAYGLVHQADSISQRLFYRTAQT